LVLNTAQAQTNSSLLLSSQGWTFTKDFPPEYTAAKACIDCVRKNENGFATDNSQSWRMLQLVTMEDIPEPFVLVDAIWLELQLVIQQSVGLNKWLTTLQVSLMELIQFNLLLIT
jgi:hypothetical protein